MKPVGNLLREWRHRRRLSQLDLACDADISARHLSFVETGRSAPSREMILHLAEQLEIPMRERNLLLVAAGYAPMFPETALGDPAFDPVRKAIDMVLEAQKPYPAFAIDRYWTIVASNGALPGLYEGVASFLLEPPLNGLRLSLHPEGLAPRIVNLAEWRTHLLERVQRQIQVTGDPKLAELMAELAGYPAPPSNGGADPTVAIPFQIRTREGVLSFFSTTTVFGTPVDITLSELALECFFPADVETAAMVAKMG